MILGADQTPLPALMMTGSSPGSSDKLRNVYLMSASYIREPGNQTHWNAQLFKTVQNVTGSASLEMRVGLFSTCIRLSSDPDPAATQWRCATNPEDFGVGLLEPHDPLGLVHYGLYFAGGVVFYGLLQVASHLKLHISPFH